MGCSGSKNANAPAQTADKTVEENTAAEKKIVEEKPVEEQFSTFKVNLEKADGQELGMTVTFPEKTHLRVKLLKTAGLVPSWNEEHVEKTEQIREGDLIMDINGVSGSSDLMMEELKKSGPLALIIKRIEVAAPAPAPASVDEPAPEKAPEKPAEEPPSAAQPDGQAVPASQPSVEAAPAAQGEGQATAQQNEEPAPAPKEEPVSHSAAQDAPTSINDATDTIEVSPEPEELKPESSTACGCF